MEKWQKRIDLNDIYSFLPDNITTGSKEFWDRKFNDMLPDGMTDVLEVTSRKEYDEVDVHEVFEQYKNKMKEFEKQIDIEFKQRANENIIIIDDEIKSE
jgi:hypothetical protein